MKLDPNAEKYFRGILFKTGDDDYHIPRLDESTRSIIVIDQSHHNLITGNYFRSGMNFTLSDSQVATFGLTSPACTKQIHITWSIDASSDGTFTLIEDVTSFAGGATVTPLNQNRISTETSLATCISGMSGADLITPTGGTTILNAVLYAGKKLSVNRNAGEGFIFKTGTNYLFRYTNGTSANVIQLACEWHCHGPKIA